MMRKKEYLFLVGVDIHDATIETIVEDFETD